VTYFHQLLTNCSQHPTNNDFSDIPSAAIKTELSADNTSECGKLFSAFTNHLKENPDVMSKLLASINAKIKLSIDLPGGIANVYVVNLESAENIGVTIADADPSPSQPTKVQNKNNDKNSKSLVVTSI